MRTRKNVYYQECQITRLLWLHEKRLNMVMLFLEDRHIVFFNIVTGYFLFIYLFQSNI